MHLNGHGSSEHVTVEHSRYPPIKGENQGTWSHTDLDLGLDMM